jgi:hypothetical protein
MPNFDFYNVTYCPDTRDRLVIKGEIQNNSGRNYSAVAIRAILFNKSIPMINTVIVVNGLLSGRTKSFERCIEESNYNSVAKLITRMEVVIDSAF